MKIDDNKVVRMKKTKRIASLALALILLLVLLPGGASAAELIASGTCGAQGNNVVWILENDGTLTISGSGEMADYSNESAVPWYSQRGSITYVEIEFGVTTIGDDAFIGCGNLISVSIPDSVTTIDAYSFGYCSNLTSVSIPYSVGYIFSSAFNGCSRLTQINVDSGNAYYSSLNGVLFNKDKTSLERCPQRKQGSYTIPSSVTRIGSGAFRGCSGLTSVTIPDSVVEIDEYAFSECSGLTSVTIPDSVTCIEYRTFDSCEGLTSVTIPDAVIEIKNFAFYGCSGLTSVTIPSSVTSIGARAFSYCNSLTQINVDSVNPNYSSLNGVLFNKNKSTLIKYPGGKQGGYSIPSFVSSIGDNAFDNCKGLTSVTIPDSVTSIGRYAFYSCRTLTNVTIPESITFIDDYTFYGCIALSSATIPSSVTSIGDSAFEHCGLTNITIPASVTHVGNSAFGDCESLVNLTIRSGNTEFGVYAFYCITGYSILTSVNLPQGMSSVSRGMFSGCNQLESVTIPDSVTSIGENAFASCPLTGVSYGGTLSQWNNLSIADGNLPLTRASLHYTADYNYSVAYSSENARYEASISAYKGSGSTVTIPSYIREEPVTGIADYAFYECSSITSVTIPSSVTSIGSWAFFNCQSLNSVTIPSGVTSIGDGAFYNCCNLTGVTIPGGVTSIGNYTFGYCSSLTSITIPSAVTSIGDYAFYYCRGLTSISIPSRVTSIGTWAFYHCDNLTSVTIPASVTDIEREAFAANDRLLAIVVDGNNPYYSSVDGIMFSKDGKTLLQYPGGKALNVTIPSGVTRIGPWALCSCHNITSVTIPDGVTTIDHDAFSSCWSLTSVTIPNSVTGIGDAAFYGCSMLTDVYFGGSRAEWEAIAIGNENDYLTGATIHFLSSSDSFTVTFNANSGTVTPTSKTVTNGEPYGELPTATRTNYAFTGWFTSASGGTQITADTIVNLTANQTLYAHWTLKQTYTVTYDANGGTGTPSPQTKEENVALTLSSLKPTKSYVIQYNANGGSVTPASKSVSCAFKNWNTSKNGSGTSYASGAGYTANADVTLYAQWTNPKAGDLAVPTRSGYAFAGWFTSATGGTQVSATSTISGNTTLYAHWTDPYNMGDETYSFRNYSDSDSPKGHCFGMAMTSAFYHAGLLDISMIGGNANTPLYSFSGTSAVKAPICYYQGIQGGRAKQSNVAGGSYWLHGWKNTNADWQAIVDYVSDHSYDDTGLLQIVFWQVGVGGHAVNFLRYENVNGQDRLYAYDNNSPNQEVYFYKDASGSIRETPYQTFDGAIDSLGLHDCRIYFDLAGDFDATHSLYMDKNSATVAGYTYSPMVGDVSGEEYVMYEIPADQNSVIIIPLKDYADFIYMDTEYSFGADTAGKGGKLVFATMNAGAVTEESSFQIFTIQDLEILQQPKNYTGSVGSTASITVSAQGDGLSYQWYFANPGATSFTKSGSKTATYSATLTEANSGRRVYCVIKDQYGNSVTTNTVTMSIGSAVSITTQPKNYVGAAGSTATATVKATGTGLTYQWYFKNPGASSFTKSGSKTATYSATLTEANSGRKLYCVIKDAYGNSVQTNTVTMTVAANPVSITTQPKNYVGAVGSTATATVKATGDSLSYQWYFANPGATSFTKSGSKTATYSATLTTANSGRRMYCVITDAHGNTAKTNTVTMTVG
jgi:uncharacterized repeat protein (TIGR02543 family)